MLLPVYAIGRSCENKACQTRFQGIAQIPGKIVCIINGFFAQEQAEIPQKSRVFQKLIFAPIDTDGIAFTARYGSYPAGRSLGAQKLKFSNKTGRIQKTDERNTAVLMGQK